MSGARTVIIYSSYPLCA